MGDRYQRSKPSMDEGEEKARKKKKISDEESFSKQELSRLKGRSLLSEGVDEMTGIMYKPKTPETRQTYELILSLLQESLGDQPRDVLWGAADEVLATLKHDKLKEKEKKREINALLGKLADDVYSVLVNLVKKITDFNSDDGKAKVLTGDELDDTYGVNVQFEEEEDDMEQQQQMLDEVVDEESDEEGGKEEEEDASQSLHASNLDGVTSVASGRSRSDRSKSSGLSPREIDAFWLQRKLSKAFEDPVTARKKAEEVLQELKKANDVRDVEKRLVRLLDYDQFDLIKIIRENYKMVLFCTLLASAQTAGEKKAIKEEMSSEPELRRILHELEGTSGEEDQKDKKSKSSKDKDPEQGQSEVNSKFSKCKMLDLEDMSFNQGSHFMANKRCQLPEGSFRKTFKGYEEVHVPALKPKSFDPNEVRILSLSLSDCLSLSLSPTRISPSTLLLTPIMTMFRYFWYFWRKNNFLKMSQP